MKHKYYRTASFKDGLLVVNNIRKEDKEEVEGLGFPILHVPYSIVVSEHATAFFNKEGDIAGIAGVFRLENNIGQIWMLCTPVIHDAPLTFVRQAKKWLSDIQADYHLLWNLADARNHIHRKLLNHLGFKAIQTRLVGPYNLPYLEIVKLCVS